MKNIFENIENISYKIASKIYDEEDQQDIDFWKYQSYKLFSQLFTFGIGIILSAIFGYTIPMCIIAILFAFVRSKIGGYHSLSFRGCFFTTNIIFIVGSLLSIYTVNYSIVMFLVSVFGSIWITPYVPKPSINTPERGELRKVYFRTVYRNRVLLLYVLNIILLYLIYVKSLDLRIYSTSISSSIIMVVIIMSNTFDGIMKRVFSDKIYG